MSKFNKSGIWYFFAVEKCRDIILEEPLFVVVNSPYEEVYIEEIDEMIDFNEEDPATLKVRVGQCSFEMGENGIVSVIEQSSRIIGHY